MDGSKTVEAIMRSGCYFPMIYGFQSAGSELGRPIFRLIGMDSKNVGPTVPVCGLKISMLNTE